MQRQLTALSLAAALGLLASMDVAAKARPIPGCTTLREPPASVWKNEGNFKAVQETWELVADENYAEAEAEFQELMGKIKDPFERSQAMFGLAQAQMAQEKFDPALKLYEQIVNMDVLQNKPHFDAMFQIAQLYYMRERYDDALRWVDRWVQESCEERVEAHELKASIYATQDEYRLALESIDKAIELSDEPKETRYQLKLAMHYELKELPETRDVLEFMIERWPEKKQYWVQLSSIQITLKNDEEALAVLALAHRKGMMDKETDWMQLYNLYGFLGIPYKAAEVLQQGIEKDIVSKTKQNWEQLGNAWYAAQELDQAIVALTNAAELSEDGKIAMQVAYILVDKEDWEAARNALETAIDKGGLSETETGNMYVLLGMSELNLGNRDTARQAFMEARKFPKARQSAQQWINHLDELAKNAQTG